MCKSTIYLEIVLVIVTSVLYSWEILISQLMGMLEVKGNGKYVLLKWDSFGDVSIKE